MKVLLISANSLVTPYPVYPLGLDYVAGAIAADHEVRIEDINNMGDYDSLGRAISGYSPDIIGISLRNIDSSDTVDSKGFMGEYRQCVDTIRRHSRAPLVLGGSGFSLFPEKIMEILGADYGIIGEGERLPLLLKAIENDQQTSGIPGVVTPDIAGTAPLPLEKSFSRNYAPDRSHLRFYLQNGGMLNLQTKRGCPFRCIYCTYPHIEGKRLRLFSPEDVASAALRLQNVGAKYLFITDSVFNSDSTHSIKVAHAFKSAGVSVPWGAFFAPTDPPDGYFETMAGAGLTHVEFGTESLSDNMLKSYRKPFQADDVSKAHEAANEAGLHVAHYFLLGGPGEDKKSLNETLSNILNLDNSVFFFFALCVFIRIRRFMTRQWRQDRFQGLKTYLNRFSIGLN